MAIAAVPNRPQPILMGDLVRSESTPDRAELHRMFNDAIEQANASYHNEIASPLTITLGDEFQGLCTSLSASLRIAQHVRWKLLEQDIACRFVIGLATLATPINVERAWNMMGTGLAEAREKLEQKRESSVYRFSLPGHFTIEGLLNAIGLALTEVENDWTNRQREIAIGSMRNPDRSAELAKHFEIRESVFYKIRRAARYDLYQTLFGAAAEALDRIDRETGQ